MGHNTHQWNKIEIQLKKITLSHVKLLPILILLTYNQIIAFQVWPYNYTKLGANLIDILKQAIVASRTDISHSVITKNVWFYQTVRLLNLTLEKTMLTFYPEGRHAPCYQTQVAMLLCETICN